MEVVNCTKVDLKFQQRVWIVKLLSLSGLRGYFEITWKQNVGILLTNKYIFYSQWQKTVFLPKTSAELGIWESFNFDWKPPL